MRRHSCRHGGAGSQRSWRRGIVWSGTRTSNDRPLTGSLRPRHISESLDIIILLPGTRAGAALVGDGFRLLVAEERAPCSTPQKLTRPDGEIRAGRVDRRRGSGGRERRSGAVIPGPSGLVRLLVSARRQTVQAHLACSRVSLAVL